MSSTCQVKLLSLSFQLKQRVRCRTWSAQAKGNQKMRVQLDGCRNSGGVAYQGFPSLCRILGHFRFHVQALHDLLYANIDDGSNVCAHPVRPVCSALSHTLSDTTGKWPLDLQHLLFRRLCTPQPQSLRRFFGKSVSNLPPHDLQFEPSSVTALCFQSPRATTQPSPDCHKLPRHPAAKPPNLNKAKKKKTGAAAVAKIV